MAEANKPSQQAQDFLKFQELGAKFNTLLNETATIIQNPETRPTTSEIEQWGAEFNTKLVELLKTAQHHANVVSTRLMSGTYLGERTILGYTRKGDPIYPSPPGMLTTQAFIICCKCNWAIKSTGGPAYGAFCVKCHEETK